MLLQLNPPIPLLTPRGKGMAHLVSDLGPEHHLEWTCLLDGGEVWTFRNPEVRALENITAGRQPASPEPVKLLDDPQAPPILVSTRTVREFDRILAGHDIAREGRHWIQVAAGGVADVVLTERFLARALSCVRGHGFVDPSSTDEGQFLMDCEVVVRQSLRMALELVRRVRMDRGELSSQGWAAAWEELLKSEGVTVAEGGVGALRYRRAAAREVVEPHSNS